jgi:uncharacterized protein (UPF0276 family)
MQPPHATSSHHDWRHLPERGVGMVYMPGLHEAIARAGRLIDFIEVEPQQHWLRGTGPAGRLRLDGTAFDAIAALGKPCIVHSVGCAIGGSESALDEQREALRASTDLLRPDWVSEHLSFNQFALGADRHFAGFLLPPLPCAASRDLAARRISDLRAAVERPVAFENGVNYLQPQPGEWRDGRFVREVAERADCAILLDLHNAWANARNGRQPLAEFLDELPLERVIELHLAGGEWHQGYWLDAHSGLAEPELLALAAELVPRLPNLRAITFEMMDEAFGAGRCDFAGLHRQLVALRRIWATRGTRVVRRPRVRGGEPAVGPAISPAEWETAVGLLATGLAPPTTPYRGAALAARLVHDPGIGVLRTLVDAVRAGTVVDALRMSTRLLSMAQGRATLVDALARHWRESSPRAIATDEAIAFGEFLLAQRLGIDGLDDLLRLEIAACRALADGAVVSVAMDHDPGETIEAVQQHRLPQRVGAPRPMVLDLAPAMPGP